MTLIRFKRGVLAALALIASSFAAFSQINVAGVYETNTNVNGCKKQMYLILDFINGTPDFTQLFTEKTSNFKSLPSDFMEAKKLKKKFSGTNAPGFAKFKEKAIFSNTEEMRIFNPSLKDGVLTAEWENTSGKKGKCFILANNDRRLQILGLTSFDRSLSPDDIVLDLVEDRLPDGATPYVTPEECYPQIKKEYVRYIYPPKVKSSDGIPNVSLSVDASRVRRCGDELVVFPVWRNGNAQSLNIGVEGNQFDNNEFAVIDGKPGYVTYMDKTMLDLPSGKEPVSNWIAIRNVPLDAEMITSLKVPGRAEHSPKANEKNPYGKYEYVISNLPVPSLTESNKPGCYVTDSELALEVKNIAVEGKDLVVEYILTNTGKRDKGMMSGDLGRGIARTSDGEEYSTAIKDRSQMNRVDIPSGERYKSTMVIPNGAKQSFGTVRQILHIYEPNFNYDCMVILKGISANQ